MNLVAAKFFAKLRGLNRSLDLFDTMCHIGK